jgi:hypothetical protein
MLLAAAPAQAEKPSGVGGGKPDKGEKAGDHGAGPGEKGGKPDKGDKSGVGRESERSHGGGAGVHIGFSSEQRERVRSYYGERIRAGHCPPGLAKKNNGCMPPGLAKQWAIGQPLPPDVVYYDLEPELVVRIGLPPPDHRFVRVAGDILLIAAGTGMVLDAIEDLGNL